MKIKTIGISHPFHLTQFLIPKVYVDVELEEGEEFNEEKKAELMAKTMEMEQFYRDNLGSQFPNQEQEQTITRQEIQPEERRIGDLASDIKSCADVRVLETYRLLVQKKPEFKAIYDEMHKMLSPKPTKETNLKNK